ncbi:trp operon leader peptide [Streptomyces sp. SID4982]|nr:trp operon leader peptide [Streptomyces sp. SID4982]
MRRRDCHVDAFRRAGPGRWVRVVGMFAQTTQNWWWTASPAAR